MKSRARKVQGRRKLGMRMVLELLGIGAAAVVVLCAFLYFHQERMLFYPTAPPASVASPANGAVETLRLVTPQGLGLTGWFVTSGARSAPLVLYFGGNAEDVSGVIGVADRFAGASLLLLNYRGYGGSDGVPGESALFEDALFAFDYAARRGDVDPRRIVAIGRSLGSGVAVYLAANRPVAGVVLVSPYDSVRALAQAAYPWLPVRLLLKHPFDSLARAPTLRAPLLCLVAERDGVIPPAHSRRLFDAWGSVQKRWVELRGADHDSVDADPRYWEEIALMLAGIAPGNG